MTTNQEAADAQTTTTGQAARLMDHLREEEATLSLLLDAVHAVHDALLARDGDRLAQALDSESQALRIGELMRERRRVLQTAIATANGIAPDDVTLGWITANVGADASVEATCCRNHLVEMSAELARLNRQNSAMIRQSLDLSRSILNQLIGPHFESYNASGQLETSAGSVVQWGG